MTKEKLIPQLRFKGFEGEWEKKKFRDLADIKRGASPRPIKDPKWFDSNSDIGWLRISDVTKQNGKVHYIEQRISKLGAEKTRVLNKPHLILSIAATIGEPAINYMKTGVHDGFLIFYNPQFEMSFGFQWLRYFKSFWQQYGQPGSQVNLNSDIVNNQEVILPLKDEQQKIGAFFEKLDKLIALNQNLLSLKKEYKHGLLQKILISQNYGIPVIRFKNFFDKWSKRVVAEIAEKNTQKNKLQKITNIESVSNVYGFKKQTEQFEGYSIASSDTSNYYVITPNTFAYNPSRINVGSIAYKNTNDEVSIVSPLYVSFKIKHSVSDLFMWYWIKSEDFKRQRLVLSEGGVRDTLSYTQFSEMKITLPSLPEQQKIGQLFQKLDQEINLYEQKIEHLKQLKKGYLQKLFC